MSLGDAVRKLRRERSTVSPQHAQFLARQAAFRKQLAGRIQRELVDPFLRAVRRDTTTNTLLGSWGYWGYRLKVYPTGDWSFEHHYSSDDGGVVVTRASVQTGEGGLIQNTETVDNLYQIAERDLSGYVVDKSINL